MSSLAYDTAKDEQPASQADMQAIQDVNAGRFGRL